MDWPKTLLASAFLLLFAGIALRFHSGELFPLTMLLIWSSIGCSVLSVVLTRRRRRREAEARRRANHENIQRHIEEGRRSEALRIVEHCIDRFFHDILTAEGDEAPAALDDLVIAADFDFHRARPRLALRAWFADMQSRRFNCEIGRSYWEILEPFFRARPQQAVEFSDAYARQRERHFRHRRYHEVMTQAAERADAGDIDVRQAAIQILEEASLANPQAFFRPAEVQVDPADLARPDGVVAVDPGEITFTVPDMRLLDLQRMQQRIEAEFLQALYGGEVPAPEPERNPLTVQHFYEAQGLFNAERNAQFEAHSKAHDRSMELLKEKLSPQQREDFETSGQFDVIGSRTGIRYRIVSHLANYNVIRLDERGHMVEMLCFEPTGQLPQGDKMLTQKIYLENAEEEALAVANLHGYGR